MEQYHETILVVEDDVQIRNFICYALKAEGFTCLTAGNAASAMKLLLSSQPDMILLDLGLPDMDGEEILKKVREWSEMPIIIVSARDQEKEKAALLDLGADDYIPKPFNPLELVARVKAQLRRCTQYNEGTKEEGDVLDFGGMFLNRTSHECVYNEVPLTLTPIEFDILWLLCENRGKVISSEELFEKVWHEKYYKNSNNTVMVHIRHLREKMSAPTGKSDFIKTVWGVGYKVEE